MKSKITYYLSVGNACNLRCKFCYNDEKRKEKQYFKNKYYIYKSIKEIRKNYNFIIIVGGEPLFHPDIFKILAYIRKLKFKTIWIVTNGIRLSNILFAKKLFQYGVTNLEFSIHANTRLLEKKITGRSGYNLVKREEGIKNIIKLNSILSNKIGLNSNTVINNINYKNINVIVKYIRNIGIRNIGISFIYVTGMLSKNNKKFLVNYEDVILILNQANENFMDINLQINWLPLCLHKNIKRLKYKIREIEDYKNVKRLKYNNLYNIKNKYRKALTECEKCKVYGIYCFGIYLEYIKHFEKIKLKAFL